MKVDITLLLEGSYPYVSGGVANWVHQIVESFPEYTFAAIFLGSRPSDYNEIRYPLPKNILRFETHYLFDDKKANLPERCMGHPESFTQLESLHEWFRGERQGDCPWNDAFAFFLDPKNGLNEDQFLYSISSWQYICAMYQKYCTDPSFIDYFWTVRNIHRPLWKLAALAKTLPQTRVLHAISTGYAGFLGAISKQETQVPLILTEHGIYTKERRIELLNSQMIQDGDTMHRNASELSYIRNLWIRFFESLSKLCYEAADPILSVFDGAKQRQLEEGADPSRARVIKNAIDLRSFRPLRTQRAEEIPMVLCLIGRVVPIKDIKTFIRGISVVLNHIPAVEGWILGPRDENSEYADECEQLVRNLDLSGQVKFLGHQNIREYLPKVGLVVLSSISESFPLSILESLAAGVPVIATDVGGCREIIFGSPGEDAALGPAGDLIQIANPQNLADSAMSLLTDPKRYKAAQQAAILRTDRYYDEEVMFAEYREVYEEALR